MIVMNRKEPVKIEIPWELHIQLIKFQGKLESSYAEACVEASKLIDANSAEFENAVKVEARRLENSSLMTKVNKNRKTWTGKGYEKGLAEGKEQGYKEAEQKFKITYLCKVCKEPLVMYPGSDDHKAMQTLMMNAGWAHQTCHQKQR
jgi:flagellar biosynthesis/type III secretory pathway protein FliH